MECAGAAVSRRVTAVGMAVLTIGSLAIGIAYGKDSSACNNASCQDQTNAPLRLLQTKSSMTTDEVKATEAPLDDYTTPIAYFKHESTNCPESKGASKDVGEMFTEQTVESCAAKCDSNKECSGFMIGLAGKKGREGECHLKTDIVLSKCRTKRWGKNWDMYTKKYIKHTNTNCKNEFGASASAGPSSTRQTVESCQNLCDQTPECTAFMLGKNHREGECFLKKDVVLSSCETAAKWAKHWDMYTIQDFADGDSEGADCHQCAVEFAAKDGCKLMHGECDGCEDLIPEGCDNCGDYAVDYCAKSEGDNWHCHQCAVEFAAKGGCKLMKGDCDGCDDLVPEGCDNCSDFAYKYCHK